MSPYRIHTLKTLLALVVDVFMTLVSIAMGLVGAEIIWIIVLLINGFFWLVRTKREVDTYHNGKLCNYITYLFKKKRKKP